MIRLMPVRRYVSMYASCCSLSGAGIRTLTFLPTNSCGVYPKWARTEGLAARMTPRSSITRMLLGVASSSASMPSLPTPRCPQSPRWGGAVACGPWLRIRAHRAVASVLLPGPIRRT